MAKYGLFVPGGSKPVHEYQGDRMSVNAEFVYIFAKIPTNQEKMVAAVRLAEGQSVKEIE